jgi:hypothetical protein
MAGITSGGGAGHDTFHPGAKAGGVHERREAGALT